MMLRYCFEEKPRNSTTKGIVFDSDGYKYYASEVDIKKNLKRNGRLRIFGEANPFSIENIKHYLKVNGINAALLSEEFDPVNLQWRCECGQIFTQQWSVFKNSHHVCRDCSKRIIGQKNARPFAESLKVLQEFHPGYKIISSDYEEGTYIYAINPNGYMVSFRRSELNKGEPLVFDTSNPFTIDNIKKWTEIHTNGEYICSSDTYVNGQEPLQFYHLHIIKRFFQ